MTATAAHFNKKGHNMKNDFKFSIFKTDMKDSERIYTETDLISIFLRQKTPIINKKQNNFYYVKYLTFR